MLRSFLMSAYKDLLMAQAGASGWLYDSGSAQGVEKSDELQLLPGGTRTVAADGGIDGDGLALTGYHYWRNSYITATRSHSLWVKIAAGATFTERAHLIGWQASQYAAYSFAIGTNGKLLAYNNGSSTTLTGFDDDLRDDKWHHFAVTMDLAGSTVKYYLDGALAYTLNYPSMYSVSIWRLGNGTVKANSNVHFDEVFSVDRVLTQEEIQSQYNHFAGPVTTDFTHNATSATADALMHNPAVEAIINPNFTHDAVVATATAAPVDPVVTVDGSVLVEAEAATANGQAKDAKIPYFVTALAPQTWNTTGGVWGIQQYALFTVRSAQNVAIDIPVGTALESDHVLASNSLTLKYEMTRAVSGGKPRTLTFFRGVRGANNTFSKVGSAFHSFSIPDSNVIGTATIPVPIDADWVYIETSSMTTAATNTLELRSPSSGNNGSFFSMGYVEPDETLLPAAAMQADGTMLLPGVSTTAVISAAFTASITDANGNMPGGYFADASVNADLMTANGLMGAAWFKGPRNVNAGPATATTEALEIESVGVISNVIVEAGVAEMSDGWINNPLEVNEDINDPYWTRVIRKSTDGALPPAAVNWFRFDERSGADVFMSSPLTGLKTTAGGELVGAFTRSRPGPSGKRAVKVDNAGLNVQLDDTWSQGANTTNLGSGASLEFTVKVAPGQTGRMDIANGAMQPWFSPGNWANTHVSVRDGKLYAMTGPSYGSPARTPEDIRGKGGTSMRRIDDGKWHHIVITPRVGDYWTHDSGEVIPLDVYIDGVRDRSFMTIENKSTTYQAGDPRFFARPDYYFGQETGYPFKGEILDVIYRRSSMNSSQVMDLYLDMFGFKAIRAGIVGAAVGAMGDAKVESNMKRMLVLSFGNVHPANQTLMQKSQPFGVMVDRNDRQRLTDMFLHGQDGKYGIGNYLMSYQQVEYGLAGDPASEMRRDRGEETYTGSNYQFRDEKTGMQRLIDIHRDVDLDDFDVIYVQGYTNPSMNTQAQRDLYEPFLNSLNKALVDGKKLWITDPYLAYDLGWVSAVDEVPVLRMDGNDVRGYDVAPHPEMLDWAVYGITQRPAPRPADGSMPVLPKGKPQGAKWGLHNVWRWDLHHNNGYRVVNEIDGLTNLPSWEVDELYVRDRTEMLPDNLEWESFGYRLTNRSGEDYRWASRALNEPGGTDLSTGEGTTYEMVKPSTGMGLKSGDEFYDYTWFDNGWDWFKYSSSANYSRAERAETNRAKSTWAIPMGHLKVGAPLTTFRSTVHDDFGNEVANPYRNHIRNAVVRPGDRLPDGRKVQGYAVMEFAMRPDPWFLTGQGIERQQVLPAGVGPGYSDIGLMVNEFISVETPYTVEWDYTRHGRVLFGGGGTATSVWYTSVSRMGRGKDGSTNVSTVFIRHTETLPMAQKIHEYYPTDVVPHQNWVSRGLSWLFTVDKIETEYSNVAVQAATATGSMKNAQIDTEFDRVVTVGAAQAYGTLVAPAEATVKDVTAFATAATASAKMTGLVGGYKAEAAQGFATMPQNVLRPLDIEEVLFFTVTMNQKTINLRMEEN